jgi:hypothetical protein
MRQVDVAEAFGKVHSVPPGDVDQVSAQWVGEPAREDRHSVFRAFAVAHDDLAVPEIDILHAQAHRFHDPHPRSVKEPTDEAMNTGELAKQALHLVGRKYDGQSDRLLGAFNAVEPGQRGVQHLLVEEEDGALRLVLGRGCNLPWYGQIGQESFDVIGAEFRRMALAVKMDKSSNPVDIRVLGPNAVVLQAEAVADADEQPRGLQSVHRGFPI